MGPTLDLGDSLSTNPRSRLPGRMRDRDRDTTSATLKLRIRASLSLNTSMTRISCTPKPTSQAQVPPSQDPFRPRASRWTQAPPRSPPRGTTPRTSLVMPTNLVYPQVKPTPTRASAPTRQTFPPGTRWDIDNEPSLPPCQSPVASTTPSVPMPSVRGIELNPPNNTFRPSIRQVCGWTLGRPLWDLGI